MPVRLLFLVVFLFFQNAVAVEVKGLYEIEVLADSRSNEDRDKAIREALTIVLGRVLAAEGAMQMPVVKNAITGASHYVRQFQYAMSARRGQVDERSRLMRVLFDEPQLLNLLRNSNVGVWSEIRPETLMWLVVEQQGKRQFYHADNMPEMENAITRASKMKGLPIIFPLLDLEDQRKISVSEVLSADSTQLLTVSKRYDVVSVMAGRVVKTGKCWQAEWALHFDDKITQWNTDCGSLDQVVLTGMQGVYDVLSVYYGVKPEVNESGTTVLRIKGIKNMTDMIKVENYLRSLTMIKSVNWVSVNDGYNVYEIGYQGNEILLGETLTASGLLTPEPGSEYNPLDLKYQIVVH